MRKPDPNDPYLDTEDTGCGHPTLRNTAWEKETRYCLACHAYARRMLYRNAFAVGVFCAAYVGFWAFLLTKAVPRKPVALLFLQTAIVVLLIRWLFSYLRKVRQHVPPK